MSYISIRAIQPYRVTWSAKIQQLYGFRADYIELPAPFYRFFVYFVNGHVYLPDCMTKRTLALFKMNAQNMRRVITVQLLPHAGKINKLRNLITGTTKILSENSKGTLAVLLLQKQIN